MILQISFIVAVLLLSVHSRCSGGHCDKFSCVSDSYVHRSLETLIRPGATFQSPCSCSSDWNTMFCNQTIKALETNDQPRPTVCICRKFNDQGAKCQQFMTRCYARKDNQCSCCFNQPAEWCNQLKCKNQEPDFLNANTTCVCHHNPADYPYEICKNHYPRDSKFSNRQAILDKHREQATNVEYIQVMGNRVSSSTVTYVIVGLLASIAGLTLLMLIVGGRKMKRRRNERQRQIRLARETLIMQRAEDDRYLPSSA